MREAIGFTETQINRSVMARVLDGTFFLILVGVPSNFFGVVNPEWVYRPGLFDIRMILIIFCALLSVIMITRWRTLLQLPAGAWLMGAGVYIGLQLIFSAMQFGAFDTFKVFRYYCLPIVAIGPLLYVLSLSRGRQLRLIRWVFIATVLQGIFYILHHVGISIFFSPVHEVIELGSGVVQRYNHAFPIYTLLVLNASLAFLVFKRRLHFGFYLVLLAIVVIIYATRAFIIQTAFAMMIVLAMALCKQGGKAIGRIGFLILFLVMGGVAFLMIFPQYPEFIGERLLELTGPEGLRSSANYNRRILFVDIAISDMVTMKDMLLGHGYEYQLLSDWLRGDYFSELSMQGDAPIAGLLYTEGSIGVFLRAMPFLILLFLHARLFWKAQNANDTMISTLIIAMIAGTGLTWLQTSVLRDLPLSLLPYFLLHRLHSCCMYNSFRSPSEARRQKARSFSAVYGSRTL